MKSGIYKITNVANGRFYIGSSVNVSSRKREHFRKLKKGKHENIHMQRLYNKYGKCSFSFEVLEKCEKKHLIEREQYYIDRLNPPINICRYAGSSLGHKWTMDQRKKASMRRKGKSNHSAYQIQRLKEIHTGKKITEKARYCNARSIIQLTLEGEIVCRYRSTQEAIRATEINNIGGVLRGFQQTAGGFRWRYENETLEDAKNIEVKERIKKENIKRGRINAAKKMTKPVEQIDPNTEKVVATYNSLKEAEIALNGKKGPNVSSCLAGRQKTAYGFKWKFKKENNE